MIASVPWVPSALNFFMSAHIWSFLTLINKKQNVEFDSPASSGGEGKYMKYVSVPWPLLETALSVFTINLFLLKTVSWEGINKSKSRLPSILNHNVYKNVSLGKIRSPVHLMVMLQTDVTVLRYFVWLSSYMLGAQNVQTVSDVLTVTVTSVLKMYATCICVCAV
jgi:hypothetical protein